jgi:preprotein translocase subunit SecF
MNQVLARSINTSLVAILPILSILVIGAWVLGATALQDFGLALFIGLTTGAYSSIFIASPTLALLKEREPRYAEIRRRLVNASGGRKITPAAAATGDLSGSLALASSASPDTDKSSTSRSRVERMDAYDEESVVDQSANGEGDVSSVANASGDTNGASQPAASLGRTPVPPRGNRPPPRPRKKGRRR